MKFTNGYWMIRDGVSALYAREAYELGIGEDGESLNILAPTTVIRGRYDTLNLPTFDIDVTSPAEGVIRVRAGHWQGATDYPGFPLNADEPGGRGYVHATAEGNGDGEVGEKKFYDPRSWGRKAEDSMSARVVEACRQLGSAGKALK